MPIFMDRHDMLGMTAEPSSKRCPSRRRHPASISKVQLRGQRKLEGPHRHSCRWTVADHNDLFGVTARPLPVC